MNVKCNVIKYENFAKITNTQKLMIFPVLPWTFVVESIFHRVKCHAFFRAGTVCALNKSDKNEDDVV